MNNFLLKAVDYILTRIGTLDTTSHKYNYDTVKSYSETDLITFFRDLKLRIFDDDDIKPDISRLTDKELAFLRKLSEDKMVIAGSHVLKLYGLLDRKTDDFDVIHPLDSAKEKGIITDKNIINGNSDDYDQKDDKVEKRIKVKYDRKKLDIFQTKEDVEIIETDGILHTHYYDTLKSKLSYRRLKDYKDFMIIKKNLGISEDEYTNGGNIREFGESYH